MNRKDARLVREGLQKLSTDTLLRAMRAFQHPPRANYRRENGDICGCFSSAAFDADDPEHEGVAYMPMVNAVGRQVVGQFGGLVENAAQP